MFSGLPAFARDSGCGVSGWKFGVRDGSPQIIHRRTPGYFLLAAYAKFAKSCGFFGAHSGDLPPFAQRGAKMIITATCMWYALACAIP